MRLEAEELCFDVANVPDSDSGVGRATADEVLVERRAVNTHDLLDVALNTAARLLQTPHIPYLHLLVIADRQEHLLIKVVPRHILHNRIVRLEILHGLLSQLILIRLLDVPYADAEVIRAREQQPSLQGVPREAETLLRVAQESQIRLDLVIYGRLRMLVVVEDVDLAILGLCRNYLRLLWHVPGFVNFALVIDLHIN